jgi:hypothetical protein
MNTIKYIAMDDADIRHYLPKARILTYNQLSKVKDIEKLLPHHKSYFILLYPVESPNSGHWCCMTRHDKTLEYFDSYGLKPDEPLEWGIFKNTPHYLSQLLAKQKLRIHYNTIDFQNKRDYTISTCGAFVVFRILTLTEMNLNLEKNNVMLRTLKESNEEKSYDDIVVEFINKR